MENLRTILTILLAFLLAYWLRFRFSPLPVEYLVALLTGLLISSIVFPATGAFRQEFRFDVARKLRRLIAGWAMVVMCLVALAAMLKVTAVYSRIWFGSWVLIGVAGLVIAQILAHLWQTRLHHMVGPSRNLVLVGAGDAAVRVEERLAGRHGGEFRLVERFGEPWSEQGAEPLGALQGYLREHEVHDVWIAVPLASSVLLEAALELLRDSMVNVHVVPDLEQYRLLNQSITEWAGLPVINLSGTPMTGAELGLKHAMDRLCAALLIVAASPLLAVCGLLVKLSGPGPVLFRQQRHGMGGEAIDVFKFRTMIVHSEPAGRMTQAVPDDQRVTAVGGWLRRTSLDELPQLFNVLRGEMSLVGPRPHPVELDGFFRSRIPRYMLRNKVKPGITGWAQVNGLRGITDSEDKMALRIEHDLWYIQNWSLWLDLTILLRTPLAMVHRNAF